MGHPALHGTDLGIPPHPGLHLVGPSAWLTLAQDGPLPQVSGSESFAAPLGGGADLGRGPSLGLFRFP